jgi:hypothetical protein
MARTVLVIGAQGVLGTFMARAFGDSGWEVTRGGRRPETTADFRLVDLDRPETVAAACAEVDLVVSAVRDARLFPERAVLESGGILIHLDDLPANERAALAAEVDQPRGLVVDHTGLGGVANFLTAAELLDQHPDTDAVELGLSLWARAANGRAGAIFMHSMLQTPVHHATARIELPAPFGSRRCLQLGPNAATESLFRGALGSRSVRFYVCFWPAPFGAAFLTLNGLRVLSRLPQSAFTMGRGRIPKRLTSEPFCYWATARREGQVLGSRFVQGHGEYQSTIAATLVFADALLPETGEKSARRGVFGVEELVTLGELEPALAKHEITVTRSAGATNRGAG